LRDGLKPCPFCDGPARTPKDGPYWLATCHHCDYTLVVKGNTRREKVVKAWNRRPVEEDLQSRLEYAEVGRDVASSSADRLQQVRGELEAEVSRLRDGLRALLKSGEAAEPEAAPDCMEDVPIEKLYLPVRVSRGLHLAGCKTVGDAILLSDAALLALPGFGMASLGMWKQCLDEFRTEFANRWMP
jgi:hypothetical protein